MYTDVYSISIIYTYIYLWGGSIQNDAVSAPKWATKYIPILSGDMVVFWHHGSPTIGVKKIQGIIETTA